MTSPLKSFRYRTACSFRDRTRGLIGVKSLPPGEGLLIKRCNCIHTFFMSFTIDAYFLDRTGQLVKLVRAIPPWRPFIWGSWRAVQVLEVASPSTFNQGAEV